MDRLGAQQVAFGILSGLGMLVHVTRAEALDGNNQARLQFSLENTTLDRALHEVRSFGYTIHAELTRRSYFVKHDVDVSADTPSDALGIICGLFPEYTYGDHEGSAFVRPLRDSLHDTRIVVQKDVRGTVRTVAEQLLTPLGIVIHAQPPRHRGAPGRSAPGEIDSFVPAGTYSVFSLLCKLTEHDRDVYWTISDPAGARSLSFARTSAAVSDRLMRTQIRARKLGQRILAGEEPTGRIVEFPDPNLRTKILEAVGKEAGPVYESELQTFVKLSAQGSGIRDLTGLGHCRNLLWLDLNNNRIRDLSPLAQLASIVRLRLASNGIRDVSAIRTLRGLSELALEYNSIGDVSALSAMVNMRTLDLSHNSIRDISALSGMKQVRRLRLHANRIADIGSLSGMNRLEELFLMNNSVKEIAALSGKTAIERLWLQDNSVTDVTPLSGLTNLAELHIERNCVRDISSLSALTKLEELWIGGNDIDDLSPLSGLLRIRGLYASKMRVSDLSPLVENCSEGGLGEGDEVYLGTNPLSKVSVNVHIPRLRDRGVVVYHDGSDLETVSMDRRGEWKVIAVEEKQTALPAASEGQTSSEQRTESRAVTIPEPHAVPSETGVEGTSSTWLFAGGALALAALASMVFAVVLLRRERPSQR